MHHSCYLLLPTYDIETTKNATSEHYPTIRTLNHCRLWYPLLWCSCLNTSRKLNSIWIKQHHSPLQHQYQWCQKGWYHAYLFCLRWFYSKQRQKYHFSSEDITNHQTWNNLFQNHDDSEYDKGCYSMGFTLLPRDLIEYDMTIGIKRSNHWCNKPHHRKFEVNNLSEKEQNNNYNCMKDQLVEERMNLKRD